MLMLTFILMQLSAQQTQCEPIVRPIYVETAEEMCARGLAWKVRDAWFPPKEAQLLPVTVVFMVNKAGEVSQLRIAKSSNYVRADQAAMRAIQVASPLTLRSSQLKLPIEVRFTFDRNFFVDGAGSKRWDLPIIHSR